MTTTNTGIIPWRNETGEFSYPLVYNAILDSNVLVDAYWIQFDSFIPTLKTVKVEADAVVFTITTHDGDSVFTLDWPDSSGKLVMYDVLGRLIGKLIFGDGLQGFYNSNLGSTLTINTKFVASTVHAVPYDSGVFSFQNATGDVEVETDGNLFFTLESQGVIFDAVGVPTCDQAINPLKSVNGVSAPNVKLITNDVINWLPLGNGIKLELASGSIFNANIVP